MLTEPERRILSIYCSDHSVARCDGCSRSNTLTDTEYDVVGRRYHLCRTCRADLTDALRVHIISCPEIAAALADALRDAQHIRRASEKLRDISQAARKTSEVVKTRSELLSIESESVVRRLDSLSSSAERVPATAAERIARTLTAYPSLCKYCVAKYGAMKYARVVAVLDAIGQHLHVAESFGACPECRRQHVAVVSLKRDSA